MEADGNRWSAPLRHGQWPEAFVACVAATALILALQLASAVPVFPHDSAEYWYLARGDYLTTVRGHRGYFFSLLLLPVRTLCDASPDPQMAYRFIAAILYGCVLPLLIPAFFVRAFGGKVSLLRRLVPVALLVQVFPGQLLYPLSDLPALLLAMGGLLLVLKAFQDASATRARRLMLMFLAGVLLAGAYNTRTIYLFTLCGLTGLMLLARSFRAESHSRLATMAVFAAGLLTVAVPQGLINQITHGKFQLGVMSQVNARDLFASQLVWGITIQRYETSIDPGTPAPTVYYLDPAGQRLFHTIVENTDLFTLRGYASALAQHPVEFLGLYARHFINGLDVRDGQGYTEKASPYRNRTAVFNFLVLVLAACVAFTLHRTGGHASSGWQQARGWRLNLALVLLPVAAILPGAIETRFFLPLHLLAYGVIAFHFDGVALRQSFRQYFAAIAIAILAAAGVFFAITTSTMASIQYDWPGIYRYGPLPK